MPETPILTETEKEIYKKAFPLVDIEKELIEMAAWLIANPKRHYKNLKRFALNWLKKATCRTRPHFQEALDRLEANYGRGGRDYRKVLIEWERTFKDTSAKDFLEAIHWVIMTPERKFWPSVMAIKVHLPSKQPTKNNNSNQDKQSTLADLSKDLAEKMKA